MDPWPQHINGHTVPGHNSPKNSEYTDTIWTTLECSRIPDSLYASGYTISPTSLWDAKSPIWLQQNTCPVVESADMQGPGSRASGFMTNSGSPAPDSQGGGVLETDEDDMGLPVDSATSRGTGKKATARRLARQRKLANKRHDS